MLPPSVSPSTNLFLPIQPNIVIHIDDKRATRIEAPVFGFTFFLATKRTKIKHEKHLQIVRYPDDGLALVSRRWFWPECCLYIAAPQGCRWAVPHRSDSCPDCANYERKTLRANPFASGGVRWQYYIFSSNFPVPLEVFLMLLPPRICFILPLSPKILPGRKDDPELFREAGLHHTPLGLPTIWGCSFFSFKVSFLTTLTELKLSLLSVSLSLLHS